MGTAQAQGRTEYQFLIYVIEFMQRCKGETPLTEQEIYNGLEQARALGEL